MHRSIRKSGKQPFQEKQKKVGGINWIEPIDSATIAGDVNSLIDVTHTVSNVILDKMLDLAELDVVRSTHIMQFNELVHDYEELRTQMNLRFDAMARYDDGHHVWVRHQYHGNRWRRAYLTLQNVLDSIADRINDLSYLMNQKYRERLEIDRYQQVRKNARASKRISR